MSLLTVGTVAFDTIETPFGKADRVIGGACTYISLAASYFTKDINLVSVVGDDFPDAELKYMKKRGINLEGLEIKEGEKSFFWAGKYHDNMNQRDTLVTELNVLADFNPILPERYKNSK
ncbi:MAG TPA: sugar kinase, partial [Phaeodactylibacter sp.]|nr:sugar kinase [Phaeodactylibacter sp.]